ncbi:hypothetical protein GCM10027176_56540 [Actinoallomurus bryophytorum]|uniref:Uncharacterized protein DUF2786 n=1 Tax=Actinoallomurus bryophytorum TaxID=1490222 RepID=A0A543C0F7_9ACTN|nr:DUF2786 domain-containing protein [Actinoallomurus bryophytorum]TQL90560.1 uncharacterized protein DUF2786 [Actinoallomurus bryophytorum]
MTIDHEGRIHALLARAEHPETPEAEAQACAAKAAELMMRHAIDEAALRARRGERPEAVVYWEHLVSGGDGHARARSAGLTAVVRAYGGACALRGDGTYRRDLALLLVATRSARDALTLLLPSLTLQMDGAGTRATDAYMDGFPLELFRRKADRTRWRNGYLKAFLVGYGDRVAERVEAVRGRLRDDGPETGALVLARDDERVREEFAARFPDLARGRAQRVRSDGFSAGRDAGRFADLGSGTVTGSRPALGMPGGR